MEMKMSRSDSEKTESILASDWRRWPPEALIRRLMYLRAGYSASEAEAMTRAWWARTPSQAERGRA